MMMKTRKIKLFPVSALSLFFVLGAVNLRAHERYQTPNFQRFSISLGGGFAWAESHQSMVDLGSEIQFGLTQRIRIGLGIGYLTDLGRHFMDRNRGDEFGGMLDGDLKNGRFLEWGYDRRGPGNDFRIAPVSLNLYYFVPVGRRWNVFATGGASYYIGSFRGDSSTQHKNAWGGHGGLGVEYRLTRRLQVVAEGGYRFAEFHGLTQTADNSNITILWQSFLDYLQTQGISLPQEQKKECSSMHLNGFTFRLGLKLGF